MNDQDRPIQTFTDEYLEGCRNLSTEQILRFLDNYRRLHAPDLENDRQINLSVSEELLATFKFKAEASGTRYQTKIKELMQEWVES